MKKIFSLIIIALSAMVSSCTDDLDQKPIIGTTSDDVYSSVEGYRSVLAKIYASYTIRGAERGGGNADMSTNNGHDMIRVLFNVQELPTDEAAYKYNSGDNLTNLTYINWDATDVWVSDTYYQLYYIIALVNEFLRYCDDGSISGFSSSDQATIRDYAYEARFVRALTYSYVLDLFGQGPYVDENTPMTGYIPEAYDGTKLYNYIISEIEDIAPNLPATPTYPRAGQGAAYALAARVALNGEVYTGTSHATDAITYSKKVLDLNYSLESDYAKLFNADNDKRTNEILFAIATDNTYAATWGSATYVIAGSCPNDGDDVTALYGVGTAWGNFACRGEFTSLFDATDSRNRFITDGRSQFFTDGIESSLQGYYSNKWTNLNDQGEQANVTDVGVSTDFPLLRLGEVYLTAAEAVLRGGTGMTRPEALALVNEVRKRAYGDESGNINDAQFTLSFMIDERARELYHELHRRSDLVRFGLFTGDDYLWQWKGGVLDGRSVNDRYNIYPIPMTELSANPNLTNPLY